MDQIKSFLLIWAEIVDAWRLAPRLVLGFYGVMLLKFSYWYMQLPDPSMEQSSVMTAVWGSAALIFNFYAKSGRAWGPQVEWEDIENPYFNKQQSNYYGSSGMRGGRPSMRQMPHAVRTSRRRTQRQPRADEDMDVEEGDA